MMQERQYINIGQFKIVLYLLGTVSFVAMIMMEYDSVFKITMLLPACYLVCLFFFVKPNMGNGIGKVAIIVMYAFRMCILPVLCAYGNFWLEPKRSVYIQYYGEAIGLSCFECFLVFGSLYYFHQHYRKRISPIGSPQKKNLLLKIFAAILLSISCCLIIRNPDFLSYFRPLIAEGDGITVYNTVVHLQSYGFRYYLLLLVDVILRPVLAFMATDYFLKRDKKFSALLVGGINVFFVTDRRILSLLIGGCCVVQILLYLKQGIVKKALYVLIGVLGIVTICYCFYGTTEPYLIARKFQRYFSGPTLTAIGIAVNQTFRLGPVAFLKRLFNDSIILTGLFRSFEVPEYAVQLSKSSSIWTPMMIGSIQYFSIFAPVIIILIVWFVIKCDYISISSDSGVYKLMVNYLAISVAIYMIMYPVELIFYMILFFGGLYKILIWLDRRIVWKY